MLDKQGIWEPADKGDWAHPLVTPAKSDGTVRITTDLLRLNKYVILTCFDVPTPAAAISEEVSDEPCADDRCCRVAAN